MFYIFIFVALLLFIYLKIYKPTKHWEVRGLKCTKNYPIVGNLLPFALGKLSLFDFIQKFYNETDERYCGFFQFTKPIIFVKDVDIIKNITIKDFDHFIDHDLFFSATDDPIFRQNVFNATGEQWRALRATLSPAFTGSKMRSMYILIKECAERFTTHFLELDSSGINKNKPIEVELKNIYKRFTIDVIATCAYGVESNSLANENNDFYQYTKDIGDFSGRQALKMIGYMASSSIMNFLKIRLFSKEQETFFLHLVSDNIKAREENNIYRPDLLHLMMEARKGNLKYEESAKIDDTGFATVAESDIGRNKTKNLNITDELIVAQAMIFFVGGTDTTSSLLSFVSHELAVNEDIQRKLQKEIDETYAEYKGDIPYETITRLKYLDMVVSESLRKWPQGYFIDRLCVKDYTIQPSNPNEKPFTIRKGDNIWISIVGIHRDPKFYPDPEKFDPERFSDANKKNINPSTFMPFGAGPRSCIANRFALLTVKTFLIYFLRHFDLVCIEKTTIPLQLSKSQVIMNSANGFWCGFKRRNI